MSALRKHCLVLLS